jgi:hypothetical protein
VLKEAAVSVLVSSALALAGIAWADTLELKDGRVVDGACMQMAADGVVFEMRGRRTIFRFDEIRGMYCFRAPPPPTPARPSTPTGGCAS